MRKIKSTVAVVAVSVGVLAPLLSAGTANAESVYTVSYINRCFFNKDYHAWCYHLGAYSTYSQTQIWINGQVSCYNYRYWADTTRNGTTHVTWYGVGGGNGTAVLNIGCNVTYSGVAGSYYERMNIYSGGGGCSTWGSNSNVNGIMSWFNQTDGPGGKPVGEDGVACEE